jgi:hypothetical protein
MTFWGFDVIKSLRRLTRFSNLDEIARFAIDIIEAWNALSRDVFLSRQTLTTTLASGNNSVSHKLGYVPTGYIVVSASAAIATYLVSKTATELIINSSGAANVTLEVY